MTVIWWRMQAGQNIDGRVYGSILSTVRHQFADKSAREAWQAVIPLV